MSEEDKKREALWQKLSKAVPGHVAPMRGSKEFFDIGFNQGWQAREPEIAELKAQIKKLKARIKVVEKETLRACDLSKKWENENEG
jgi:hypothetical protein